MTGHGGQPEGRLVLGDNSRIHLGTPTYPAQFLAVGYSDTSSADSKPQGFLDASRGNLEAHVLSLYVGNNYYDSAGPAAGTLTLGTGSVVTAASVRISRGPGTTGMINLNGGLLAGQGIVMDEGGTLNFTGGRLAVNTFVTYEDVGALEQRGGVLAPGWSRTETSLPGQTILNGDYLLGSLGTLEIELFGTSPKTEYDQLLVNGLVDLNHNLADGGILDLILHFGPEVGDEFLLIDNRGDEAVMGRFADLPDGAWFTESYAGDSYIFQINYFGYSGNDVVLTMTGTEPIPVPAAALLVGVGSVLVGWLHRRRTL